MKPSNRALVLACGYVVLLGGEQIGAQDWPQWRGPHRDAKTSQFTAPAQWPAELTKKWTVDVGNGVATPSLVDDKLYVFTRQDENEVVRCLDATTGDELWRDEYQADTPTGGAGRYPGPRSTPTVASGKVVTLGVQGMLTCYDAETGQQVWRKDDFENDVPRFNAASSPLVVDGTCIVQLGDEDNGGIVAFDLATGEEKWRWMEDGPAYGSPVLMEVDDTQVVITPTDQKLVAIDSSTGSLLWEMRFSQGRYNTCTPIVVGNMLIVAGSNRDIIAVRLEKQGDELTSELLWRNSDATLRFNTPIFKDDLVIGLSESNSLFCFRFAGGAAETAWTAPLGANAGKQRARPSDRGERQARRGDGGRDQGEQREGAGRRRGRRGGRRGGGGGGYGSVVDAGSALFALSPGGELVVFEPSREQYNQLASYKVAEGGTYAYPVISRNRVFIKDQDSLTLWTF